MMSMAIKPAWTRTWNHILIPNPEVEAPVPPVTRECLCALRRETTQYADDFWPQFERQSPSEGGTTPSRARMDLAPNSMVWAPFLRPQLFMLKNCGLASKKTLLSDLLIFDVFGLGFSTIIYPVMYFCFMSLL